MDQSAVDRLRADQSLVDRLAEVDQSVVDRLAADLWAAGPSVAGQYSWVEVDPLVDAACWLAGVP